jgi:hypothetical protein
LETGGVYDGDYETLDMLASEMGAVMDPSLSFIVLIFYCLALLCCSLWISKGADADDGLFPIFIFNTLSLQVLFMSVNMEALNSASERIARDADRSITNFICFYR